LKIRPAVLLTVLLVLFFAVEACSRKADVGQIKQVVSRYNELLIWGYKNLNMNPLQEVATEEQATKAYYHMSAMGEGKLRMDSTLKTLDFKKLEFQEKDKAVVETREVWDFTHIDINTGKKYAEEKDFIYEMGYLLKKQKDRWIVTNVTTISGQSTNTVIPWPEPERRKGEPPKQGAKSDRWE
jgi:hypothetical protein